MKKILIALTIAISCLGINKVSADSIEFTYDFNSSYFVFEDYEEFKNFLTDSKEVVSELYKLLFEKYETDYKNNYPYFLIQMSYTNSDDLWLDLIALDAPVYFKINETSYAKTYFEDDVLLESNSSRYVSLRSIYSFNEKMYEMPIVIDGLNAPAHYGFSSSHIYENYFIDSNFDLKFYTDYDNIIIHNFRDTNSDYIINSGDIYPTLYKNGISSSSSYTEINLNDYAYIALAPKEFYSDETTTTVYVKGQYCLTPVYNYGLRERNDVLSGTKMQRCSVTYEEYTPVRTYLLKQDMQNKSIYYVKAYNTNIENKIKVDNSVFDITYITEEQKNEPYVYIQGKYYPTIPYDKLTDTATKSEDEGYNAGTSCAVGDLNCHADYSSSFSDIFDAPLEFLEGVWDSIVSVFNLITELLSLLPPVIRDLLYLSFTLALIIGLIKIIL